VSAPTRPQARTGGRRPAGETRALLVEAAVRLLSEEGPSAVTTTRLAAEVGIVQSGFYAHFGSVDEVVAAACSRVVDQAREPIGQWMLELVDADPGDLTVLAAHYRRVLDLLAPRWGAIELVLRHRRDPTLLGTRLAEVWDVMDADIVEYLLSLVPEALRGPPPASVRRRVSLLAHLLVGAVTNVLETLADDPEQDRDAASRTLAVLSHHTVTAAFDELFPAAAEA
jgi:AcrR family transcriptional regulator